MRMSTLMPWRSRAPTSAARAIGVGREQIEVECRSGNAVNGHRGRTDDGERDRPFAQDGHDLGEEIQPISSWAQRDGRRPA